MLATHQPLPSYANLLRWSLPSREVSHGYQEAEQLRPSPRQLALVFRWREATEIDTAVGVAGTESAGDVVFCHLQPEYIIARDIRQMSRIHAGEHQSHTAGM
jgi:hypothetical protein